MNGKLKSKSLFDDIFKLQSAAPELDIDPEDPEDGFKASLVDAADETEAVGPSALRRKAAIIEDDPKYNGQKASRKDLYSDDEEEGLDTAAQGDSDFEEDSRNGDTSDDEMSAGSRDSEEEEESNGDGGEAGNVSDDMDENEKEEDATILQKSDDREKGKGAHQQLSIWDQLIKSRISLQKVLSLCNQLPQPDTWADFAANDDFHKEASNAHSSVRKLVAALIEVQKGLSSQDQSKEKGAGGSGDSDEEITSESEGEEDEDKDTVGGKSIGPEALDKETPLDDDMSEESGDGGDESEEEASGNDVVVPQEGSQKKQRQKRKLDAEEVEEVLSKHHKGFQTYRNDTLSKWDEKTRLTHGKVRAKNFAAFEMSVLKQIEQVLVNRERLIRRIHQQRTAFRILGCPDTAQIDKAEDDVTIEDDDEVEVEIKQRSKQDVTLNPEIIDDNDFYHVCLRDLIEMKQNEEMDPVTANKQWLEIQRLRNKEKRKVDTRASKGRKIRYNIREKLKNFMTPYDKSSWSDEQKDDLFKALFGGRNVSEGGEQEKVSEGENRNKEGAPTINIGL
ncbi:protein AATF [Aplysia californica]|uniref:Protein AATF n=1 Tax=Aplysia californica TaxID=6500 RepID=A0ABM0K573_APLCA|nr:protein AATF [Aplysia californica]